MTVPLDVLAARIADVNALMDAHAGAIELVDVSPDGTVRVRYVGKCSGCEIRPLTMAATIRPALLAVAGVTGVEAAGARISDEAAQRVAAALGPDDERVQWLERVHQHRNG